MTGHPSGALGHAASGDTRLVYRRVAPYYDGFRVVWSRLTRTAEDAVDALFRDRIRPTSRVLELAPGTGVNLDRLFARAPGFASYLGIDSSEDMLARARIRARGDPRVRLELGDATRLDDVRGAFDFVVCTWLLSHLDDPVALVRASSGLLAPGGSAVFVFLTKPRNALCARSLECLGRPLRYDFVDPSTMCDLPNVERVVPHANGLATVLVLRAPD